jgi:hypothetical protein
MYNLTGDSAGFRTLAFNNPYKIAKQNKLKTKGLYAVEKDIMDPDDKFFNYTKSNSYRACYHYIAWISNIENEKLKKIQQTEIEKSNKRNLEVTEFYNKKYIEDNQSSNSFKKSKMVNIDSICQDISNIDINCKGLVNPYKEIKDNYITIHHR